MEEPNYNAFNSLIYYCVHKMFTKDALWVAGGGGAGGGGGLLRNVEREPLGSTLSCFVGVAGNCFYTPNNVMAVLKQHNIFVILYQNRFLNPVEISNPRTPS